MNDTRAARTGNRRGNGRSPAENHEYARVAANSQSRATQVANAAAGRSARTAKLAAEIDPAGTMDPDELAREIKRLKDAQLSKARAVRLTMLRRAREAAAALIDAEASQRAAEADIAEA